MEQINGDFSHAHNKDTARDHGEMIPLSFGGHRLKPCVPTQQKKTNSFVLMKV